MPASAASSYATLTVCLRVALAPDLRSFNAYGESPVTTLVEELDMTRDDLVTDLRSFVPPIVEETQADGRLEKLVRDRLEILGSGRSPR